MKNSAKTKQIKVKPNRLTRAERKIAERAEQASEQLAIYRQNGAFHRAYLEIELDAETAKYEAIQARLAELQNPDPEIMEAIAEEADIFDELEAVSAPNNTATIEL